MKMIDAHMHFNMKHDDPVEDLLGQMRGGDLSGGVLILNSPEEKKLFLNSIQRFHGQKHLAIGFLVDCENGHGVPEIPFPLHIKLHPRLSQIRLAQFDSYMRILQQTPQHSNLIIDAFPYGHDLGAKISTELAIQSALAFPDRKIIVAHSGGVQLLETLLYTKTLKNIYYDLSLTINYLWNSSIHMDMIQLIKFHFDRVMIGSDYPDFTPVQARENFLALSEKAGLGKGEIDRVLYTNAQDVYHIK